MPFEDALADLLKVKPPPKTERKVEPAPKAKRQTKKR